MKTTKLLGAVVLLAVLLLTLTACGKTFAVTVNDAGTVTALETKTGKTVAAVLEEAGITLGDKDEVDPAPDVKLTEDVSAITVKRYAKVTVVRGKESKEAELVGGTVEEALKAAGITLGAKEGTDVDADAFLTDGMTIHIVTHKLVELTADGKTASVKTAAATVQEFLDEQKLTLGKDDELSEKADAKIQDGMKLTIKRVEYKTETVTEEVDFSTLEETDSSLAAGASAVRQQGVPGEKEVTYKIKLVDGKEDSREAVSEKVTKEAVDKIIAYGPRPAEDVRTVVSKTPVPNCNGDGHGYYDILYSDGTHEYVEY